MDPKFQPDPNLTASPAYYEGGVPVFKPTMEQFRDFYKYNKAINQYGMQLGIVKVIPPVEWTQLLRGTYTTSNLEHVRIKNPIVQNMNVTVGYQGVYLLQNVERQRSYNIFQWKDLSLKPNFVPPKKTRRGLPLDSRSPEPDPKSQKILANQAVANRLLAGEFNIDVSEFTPERCEELEQLYWKSLGYAEPMYGADMLGSLFLEKTTSWNVAKLPNILDLMEEKIPGVNNAYLYAGLWKASFSWHLEDQDLYLINYLHFGAPKQWYSIPQSESGKFYKLMREVFVEDYKNCSEFLRHKTFLASPQFLAKNGITCNHIVHRQGEYMITYPFGYHAGFNFGFNLAESVNFALDDWFEFAPNTKKCECISDSVGLNHKQLYCKFMGLPYEPELPLGVERLELENTPVSATPEPVSGLKRGRKKRRVEPDHECALCPINLPEKLKNLVAFQLLDSDVLNSRTHAPLQAHRICAEQFPNQLSILKASRRNRTAGERVTGLLEVPRPVRNLKCGICHVPNRVPQLVKNPANGACFQCSAPKCTRLFHATCALASGFLFEKRLCRQHREKLPNAEQRMLYGEIEKLSKGSLIHFTMARAGKRHSGEVYCGIVTANGEDETLQAQVFPHLNDEIEIQYKDVFGARLNLNLDRIEVSEPELSLPRTPRKHLLDLAKEPFAVSRIILPSSIPNQLPPQVQFPPMFALNYELATGMSSSPSQNGIVFINEYSETPPNGTPEPSRIRFVEESFSDNGFFYK